MHTIEILANQINCKCAFLNIVINTLIENKFISPYYLILDHGLIHTIHQIRFVQIHIPTKNIIIIDIISSPFEYDAFLFRVVAVLFFAIVFLCYFLLFVFLFMFFFF